MEALRELNVESQSPEHQMGHKPMISCIRGRGTRRASWKKHYLHQNLGRAGLRRLGKGFRKKTEEEVPRATGILDGLPRARTALWWVELSTRDRH